MVARQINSWTGTPGSGVVQFKSSRNGCQAAVLWLMDVLGVEENEILDRFSNDELEKLGKEAVVQKCG